MSARAVVVVAVALALSACWVPPTSIPLDGPAPFDPTRALDDEGAEGGVEGGEPSEVALVFGVTPFVTPERQAPWLARLETYLSRTVGVPVTTRVSETFEDAIDALDDGSFDVALLSPFTYVTARARIPTLHALATAVAHGSATYASYLVVERESEIRTVSDVRGKRLGLVDPLSTAGHVLPRAWLARHGIDIDTDVVLSWRGSHDAAYAALVAGAIDVAALSSDTLVNDDALGIAGPVRVLAKTGRVPCDALVARPGLSPAMLARVRRAFLRLSIHDEEGRAILKDDNLIDGFMPIPPGHYDSVARAAEDAQ